MPTEEQILERFKKGKERDVTGLWFEFSGKLLVPYLPFDYLKKEFAKEGSTDEDIKKITKTLDRNKILKEAFDYLNFAWDKCYGQRGISANRSLGHYIEWFWLAGEDEFSNNIEDEFENHYHSYGEEILKMIEVKLTNLLGIQEYTFQCPDCSAKLIKPIDPVSLRLDSGMVCSDCKTYFSEDEIRERCGI